MSSQMISVTKGRIAQTTKANAARNLPTGLWSVVCSPPYDKPAEGGTVSKSKIMDLLFYVTKEDAWEESAFLLGKRADETAAATAARRGRGMGGGITVGISMTVCANMGVGRVEGEYNTSGSRLHGPNSTDHEAG